MVELSGTGGSVTCKIPFGRAGGTMSKGERECLGTCAISFVMHNFMQNYPHAIMMRLMFSGVLVVVAGSY